MVRALLALAAIAVGATVVLAQSDPNAVRKEFMKTYGKHAYTTLNRMVRDRMPYDQAKVDEALAHFAATAAKIPSLFPAGGYQGPVPDSNYYAVAKTFESQNDLQARAGKFAKDIADNKDKIKDLAALKAIWPDINKNNCDSCHEAYRLRRQS